VPKYAAKNTWTIYKVADLGGLQSELAKDEHHLVHRSFQRERHALQLYVPTTLSEKEPYWLPVIKALDPENPHLGKLRNQTAYFVLLVTGLTNPTTKYMVTGGPIIHALRSYCDPSFGLETLFRYTSLVLSQRESNLTGDASEIQTVYRSEIDLATWIRPKPSLLTDVLGKTDAQAIEEFFGIELTEGAGIRLHGSTGFSVLRKLTAGQLFAIIDSIDQKSAEKAYSPMSAFEWVKEKGLVKSLNEEMLAYLNLCVKQWMADSHDIPSYKISLSFRDAYKLVRSDMFALYFEDAPVGDSFDMVKFGPLLDLLITHKQERPRARKAVTWKDLKSYQIRGFDADGSEQFRASLGEMLFFESERQSQQYIRFGRRWYFVKSDYLHEVDQAIEAMLTSSCDFSDIALETWDVVHPSTQTEDQYLAKYNAHANCIKMHKRQVRVNGQNAGELCDIYWNHPNSCLIHVKREMGAEIRELCSQARLSIVQLREVPPYEADAVTRLNTHNTTGRAVVTALLQRVLLLIADSDSAHIHDHLRDRLSYIAKMELAELSFVARQRGVPCLLTAKPTYL